MENPGYFFVLLWSLLILAAFWGYGSLLRRALNRPEFADLGWGLTTAWGMAFVMLLGGLLMSFSAAKAPVLTAVVLAGALAAVFLGVLAAQESHSRPKSPWTFRPGLLLVVVLAGLAFASSIAWMNHIDPNDDLVCYLMLPEKILATGTLIEPFSFQRAGTFGGQSLLQALVMIVGTEVNGHVPDRGFAMVILFGIFLGPLRPLRGAHAVAAFALLFAFWFVPVPRISTNGAMTGGCLLVAMLDALRRMRRADQPDFRLAVPVAITAAAACSVRPTFTVTIGVIFAALFLRAILRHRPSPDPLRRELTALGGVALGCGLLLIPFMVVLYQSNGTPMIPPFSGYVSKGFQTFDHPSAMENLATIFTFASDRHSLALLALLGLAFLLPGEETRRLVVGALLLASAVIVFRFGALAHLDLYRYIYPLALPVALWLLALALRQSSTALAKAKNADGFNLPVLSTVSAAVILVFVNASQGYAEMRAQALSLGPSVRENRTFLDPRLHEAYRAIQNAIPPGEKVLTMVDASYWFDYARNPMFSINAVGSSSPPPGLPYREGSAALASYLRGLGIRYVVAVDFNNAVLLYTRALWTTRTRPEWFYAQIWRPRFLDFMDNVDEWDREGKVTARAGNLRLFKL